MTEEEMIGWHHQLSKHEFKQALGVGDGQGSLACCSPRSRKESDTRSMVSQFPSLENGDAHNTSFIGLL